MNSTGNFLYIWEKEGHICPPVYFLKISTQMLNRVKRGVSHSEMLSWYLLQAIMLMMICVVWCSLCSLSKSTIFVKIRETVTVINHAAPIWTPLLSVILSRNIQNCQNAALRLWKTVYKYHHNNIYKHEKINVLLFKE